MADKLILYVEDDPLSREVMELIVQMIPGYHLAAFADSANFETNLVQLPQIPAVILLDIHVQPHDGFEMLEMLRAKPSYRSLPVVALTASVMNEEVQRLRQAGFDSAIAKPVDQDAFPEHLHDIVNGRAIWSIVNHME
jgi:two-component system, cell cycle response regulator DivK